MSLAEIGTGNEKVITALVKLLQSTTVDENTRKLAAEILGKVLQNNQERFAVVEALSNY